MPRLTRTQIIHGSLLVFAFLLVVRASQVQLWEGKDWAGRANRQHFGAANVPAPRGDIFDIAGVPLAQSRELTRLSIAPREVPDRPSLIRELARLRVPRNWSVRAADRGRKWVTLPGLFLPADAAALTAMRGVYTAPVLERVYSRGEATRRVVGRVSADGDATDGIELALDSLLRGTGGTARVSRDARGRRFESPSDRGVAPEPGEDVVLTINRELQDISEQALSDAMARMGAEGGDIVILDPHDGEIRALVSRRAEGFSGSPALAEPFEPGSTLKPFIAAFLLERERARADERIDTENGQWTLDGRTISDIHREASMTLSEVIQHSSNVGIVKFAQRLSPREQFEMLRDLGFGTPTGVSFPSEAAGTLRAPGRWSPLSPASLAMGYEIAVTPLQLAAAYATFANGGELVEPALVKEIRSPSGDVKFRHERRIVRRVMSEETAATVRAMLVGAVEGGTAAEAGLGSYAVAGKTGTARRTGAGKGYDANAYTATFVGLFPADEPQYVVLVKLDRPSGAYYGGRTAAPVTRAVLEAAIAARNAALDRRALASKESVVALAQAGAVALTEPERDEAMETARTSSHVVALPPPPVERTAPSRSRAVPNVHGLSLRAAVRSLHDAGFRVQLTGFGDAAGTIPVAGSRVPEGSLIRLVSLR